ncbi:hypothetical protein [Tropicibacter sp. Alg240-R139]|uniref:hypothetical protein n=1 Tax=Tropicibacter sp. Alg240-R139 TaxID=2305991 RepID=UPI0013DEE4A6|nr:hypothetical protein [Tropicibacter sp. Alg240-R139]
MNKIIAPALLGMVNAGVAQAQESSPWYLQAGVAHVAFQERAEISIGGAPVAGADGDLTDETTIALGLGYRFHDNWS